MMELYNAVFVLQFVALLAAVFVKLFNVMSKGEFYSFKAGFMVLIGGFVAFGVGLVALMSDPGEVMFISLFRFETWMLLLFVMLFVVEILLLVGSSVRVITKANNSREIYKNA